MMSQCSEIIIFYFFFKFILRLDEISAAAAKEYSMEKAIAKMKEDWADMTFELVPYRETVSNLSSCVGIDFKFLSKIFLIIPQGVKILSSVDEIQLLLDDHVIKAMTMLGSPYIKPLEQEAREWSNRLQMIQEILDEWLKVQATWLYLEPIFGSEDIIAQMPEEGRKFAIVDGHWRDIMAITVCYYFIYFS